MIVPPRSRVLYSPIVGRPNVRWPNDARVALWISPNVEHYEYTPTIRTKEPYGGRLPHPDVREYSSRDYGNRVGIWRMTDVLDEYGVRCTVSLNLAVLDHYPEIAQLISSHSDWSVMSHGIYNTSYLYGMTPEEELSWYRDSIESLKRHTGLQLKGMLGPAISGTYDTPDLMAEAGLTYHADWVHDDQPVPIAVKRGRMVSVPYSYELDDAPMFFKNHDGEYFTEICKRQFDRLYAAGQDTGQVMCIAVHPFQIGQPHNIGYLREVLDYIGKFDAVWQTTADEIVDYYLAECYDRELAYVAGLEERNDAR